MTVSKIRMYSILLIVSVVVLCYRLTRTVIETWCDLSLDASLWMSRMGASWSVSSSGVVEGGLKEYYQP
jgi:hypothetical protein